MNRVRSFVNVNAARRRGLTGRGVCVAVIDTGLFMHRDFVPENIITFKDFVGKRSYMYDDCGHGTHVCGIIGGNGRASSGKYEGIAPGVSFVVLKALDKNGNGKMEHVIKAIEWLIANHREYNIRIVNISIGATVSDKNADQKRLLKKVDELWNDGVTICAAAGNNGPGKSTVSMPGVSAKVITVGFVSNGKVYSGRGPTGNCIIKPEIVAPGENVVSCMNTRSGYAVKSGSSMATPIVSGALALLLESNPYLTNKEIKKLLYERARDMGLSKNIQGWGCLDIERLLC